MSDLQTLPEFKPWPKIARWSRKICVTEKLDGSNASVYVSEDKTIIAAGSRNRWLTLEKDNFGFAAWVAQHADDLRNLGPGTHYGEWWGLGIQRGYGLHERRFSLFNTGRWLRGKETPPACCSVVPILYEGACSDAAICDTLLDLQTGGSIAAPGFAKPEGIVIYHMASRTLFKKTLLDDEKPKGAQE